MRTIMLNKMQKKGFSLIELVIFIMITAVSIGVLLPLLTVLHRVHNIDRNTLATELAQQRMELILANRYPDGFSKFADGSSTNTTFDPCSNNPTADYCLGPTSAGSPVYNYSVASNIDYWPNAVSAEGRLITVTVSGAGDATLKTLVTDY